jgi:rod shape-determining protein MreC
VPRNRASTARPAILGSSVRRSAAAPYPYRSTRAALRRRIVLGLLVLASLALVTVYFRESSNGSLHGAQSAAATVLRPFEVGAERVVRPFRDLYGWTSGIFHARSENERLRTQVDELLQQYAAARSALAENVELRGLLRFQDTARYPADFRFVNARVIAGPPSPFEQQLVVAAGSAHGVSLHDPVVTAEGLVGEVTKVAARTAQVTLLTDPDSAVATVDVSTGAFGIVKPGRAGGDSLLFGRVTKDQVVLQDDVVVSAGTLSGRLRSLYPKDIPIGVVTSVGSTDTDLFKQIQIDPFVDFSSLHSVAVLVSRRPKLELP